LFSPPNAIVMNATCVTGRRNNARSRGGTARVFGRGGRACVRSRLRVCAVCPNPPHLVVLLPLHVDALEERRERLVSEDLCVWVCEGLFAEWLNLLVAMVPVGGWVD
jgi:hypothetical protein